MACPDDPTLERYGAETLALTHRAHLAAHLATCASCQKKLLTASSNGASQTGELGSMGKSAAKPTFQKGSLVGRYVVLEVLGSGGMGEVYIAIDPELDRRVALKLVKSHDPGSTDSSGRQTRLLREAQAMAKLSHPNVVSIFDVGVAEGRVFLAMELVTGTTLNGWLDETPRTWAEVLAVFKQAGTGLAAAHHAGMIHRDFKPDNILIGRDGRVRVSDFGLARAAGGLEPSEAKLSEAQSEGATLESVSQSLLSTPMTHGILGTPGYMAPEQLLGTKTDEKSDQFSFCVSLYRALYRQTPFVAGSMSEMISSITAREVRPAPKDTLVPTWVRRIVLRGLSASPHDRFTSMDAVLAALERDPSKARRRWLSLAVAAVGVAVVAGGAVAAVKRQSQRCRGAEERVALVWSEPTKQTIHQQFLSSGLPYAEDAWGALKASLDRYGAEWAAQQTEACEATWVRGEQSDAVLSLRLQCLNARLDELGALATAMTSADASAIMHASTASSALTQLNRCSDVTALERRTPFAKNDEVTRRVEALEHRIHEANSQFSLGHFADAEAQMRSVVAEARVLGFPPLLAQSLRILSRFQGASGKYDGLREQILESIRYSELSGDDENRFLAFMLLIGLGDEQGQKYEAVLAYGRLGENVLSRIQKNDWHRARLATLLGNLAFDRGHFDEALAQYEKGRSFALSDPNAAGASLVNFDLNLGLAYTELGQNIKGLALEEQAAAAARALLGVHHPNVGLDYANIADLQARLFHFDDALENAEKALRIDLESVGPAHINTVRAWGTKASALRNLGRPAEAEQVVRHALAVGESLGPANVTVPEMLQVLAEVLVDLGKLDEARATLERVFEIRKKIGSALEVGPLVTLGEVFVKLNDPAHAEERLRAALTLLDAQKSPDRAALVRVQFSLAKTLWPVRAQRAQSRALAEKALADLAKVEGETRGRAQAIESWLRDHRL